MLLIEIRLVEGRQPPPAESLLLDETDREVIRQLYERLSEGSEKQKEKEEVCDETPTES
jgi:hypothetical protein